MKAWDLSVASPSNGPLRNYERLQPDGSWTPIRLFRLRRRDLFRLTGDTRAMIATRSGSRRPGDARGGSMVYAWAFENFEKAKKFLDSLLDWEKEHGEAPEDYWTGEQGAA